MAITLTTVTRPAGFTASDVINQLEEALSSAGLHGGALTGLAGGPGYCPDPETFGGTVGTVSTFYRDIAPVSTSGAGTGATFNIERRNGKITGFPRVNRPGKGYQDLDTVTISANDIGGLVDGATNITFPIFVDSTVSGASTYSLSYTGNFILSGTDRLGSYSNVPRTTSQDITVMEGDTLVFTSTMGLRFYFLVQDGFLGTDTTVPMSPAATSGEGSSSNPLTVTWNTRRGQAGTYYISSSSSSPGAVGHNIIVLPADGSRTFTPNQYGSTTTFFNKRSNPGLPFPWGCLRQEIQANKKYGSTYRVFQISNQNRLEFSVGSSFMPVNSILNSFSGRFKGSQYLDLASNLDTDSRIAYQGDFLNSYGLSSPPTSSTWPFFGQAGGANSTIELEGFCSLNAGNAFSLDLNVYRSSLDPSFAVFSYKQPNLSSTDIKSNSFLTFFLHNFTTSVWDLDNVFLSGFTSIISNGGNTTAPELTFRTYCAGSMNISSTRHPSIRAAEFGYLPMGSPPNTDLSNTFILFNYGYKDSVYRATSYPGGTASNNESYREASLYYRTNQTTDLTNRRGLGMPDESNFNAIIKGIPLNTTLIPTPYYLPDDFVLVMFDNATPSLNVQQGDRLVVEEDVEEYVIITGSYNQTLRTRGILFCARIV